MRFARLAPAAAILAVGLQISAALACSNGGAASSASHVMASNAVGDQSPAPQQRQMQFHWDKNGQYGYWMPAR